MKKLTLTAASTIICSLSIAVTIAAPSFANPPANKAALTGNNPQVQLVEQLKITKDQQTKLAKVERTAKQKIFGVLTPAQQEQVRLDMKQGKPSSLKFTTEQQTKLKEIQTVAVAERDAILTTEQKQKLEQFRKQYMRQS